jgi:hypothetical protein
VVGGKVDFVMAYDLRIEGRHRVMVRCNLALREFESVPAWKMRRRVVALSDWRDWHDCLQRTVVKEINWN